MRLWDFDEDEEDDEVLNVNPENWDFEFSERELAELREAFNQFQDGDGEQDQKISFLELFEGMEDRFIE